MKTDFIHVKPTKSGQGFMVCKDDVPIRFINENFFLDKEDAEKAARNLRHVQFKTDVEKILGRKV